MFRRVRIEVTGGDESNVIVLLMKAVGEAIRRIYGGISGTTRFGGFDQCKVEVEIIQPGHLQFPKLEEELRVQREEGCVTLRPVDLSDIPEGECYCHADKDGDCSWSLCPQKRDHEPELTGRHCPLDNAREAED